MIELAPNLAEVVFGILPTVQLVEAVPTVVVPIVAAVPTGSVGIFVVVEQQQLAQLAPCDHFEGVARCITPGGSPIQ